jgi:hypothetical protein
MIRMCILSNVFPLQSRFRYGVLLSKMSSFYPKHRSVFGVWSGQQLYGYLLHNRGALSTIGDYVLSNVCRDNTRIRVSTLANGNVL